MFFLGGGFETPSNYPTWKIEHAKFDPPVVVQASFTKLLEGMCVFLLYSEALLTYPVLCMFPCHACVYMCCAACYDTSLNTSSGWFGRVESSGWLTHVTRLLEYGRKIALAIHSDSEWTWPHLHIMYTYIHACTCTCRLQCGGPWFHEQGCHSPAHLPQSSAP